MKDPVLLFLTSRLLRTNRRTKRRINRLTKGIRMFNAALDNLAKKVDALTDLVSGIPAKLTDIVTKAQTTGDGSVSTDDINALSAKVQADIDAINNAFQSSPAGTGTDPNAPANPSDPTLPAPFVGGESEPLV